MSTGAVGVFGGSFDPPHAAHVLAAAYVLCSGAVDRVLVVPAYRHPFAKPLAPYEHRVRMCELAMADLRRTEVSRVEGELGGESLTVCTLEELRARMPGVALRLIIGSDLVAESTRWHDAARVRDLAELLVVAREGHPSPIALPVTLPRVSSTEIRRLLRAGEPVDGLVPRAVAEYADAHGLYGSERDTQAG